MPQVSVLVVLGHEPEDRIARAVRRVAAQQGIGSVELLIAGDQCVRAAAMIAANAAGVSAMFVDNPGGERSAGLNRMLAQATGEFVVRVDARSLPADDYLARCVGRLSADPAIGIVGAFQRPIASGAGVMARGVARALGNALLLGAPAYRGHGAGGPADTVYLGAFRAVQLRAMGGWDESLAANEDFSLCQRYRDDGMVVWLEPGLDVAYEARSSVSQLWSQYVAFGRSKVRFWRTSGHPPNGRQRAALAAATIAVVALGAVTVTQGPAGLILGAAAGVAGLGVVDAIGAVREPGGVSTRMAGIVASGVVLAGWLAGVALEAATGRRPRRTLHEAPGRRRRPEFHPGSGSVR
jgi:hypothetical protein